MKLVLFVLLVATATTMAHAETYAFRIGRFTDLTFITDKGKAKVIIEDGDKVSSAIVFEARLKPSRKGSFVTKRGTIFHLQRLKEKVINDANRHINSGNYKLVVSGKGPEYDRIVAWKSDFAENDEPEYFGEKR